MDRPDQTRSGALWKGTTTLLWLQVPPINVSLLDFECARGPVVWAGRGDRGPCRHSPQYDHLTLVISVFCWSFSSSIPFLFPPPPIACYIYHLIIERNQIENEQRDRTIGRLYGLKNKIQLTVQNAALLGFDFSDSEDEEDGEEERQKKEEGEDKTTKKKAPYKKGHIKEEGEEEDEKGGEVKVKVENEKWKAPISNSTDVKNKNGKREREPPMGLQFERSVLIITSLPPSSPPAHSVSSSFFFYLQISYYIVLRFSPLFCGSPRFLSYASPYNCCYVPGSVRSWSSCRVSSRRDRSMNS